MGKSCKVVVCGQATVGKTAILEQLLYGNHVAGALNCPFKNVCRVCSVLLKHGRVFWR